MTEDKIKRYPGIVVVKKDTEMRLEKLKKEIEELKAREERAERKHEESEKIVTLVKIKEDRLRVLEKLLAELEKSTLKVEETIMRAAPELTPLEMIIVTKLYVEGVKWTQLFDVLQTDPEYCRFCYERSTYMRAHRSALDKLSKWEE